MHKPNFDCAAKFEHILNLKALWVSQRIIAEIFSPKVLSPLMYIL